MLSWLTAMGIQTCIASFDPVPDGLGFFDQLKERIRRDQYGYRNHLTEGQLIECFARVHMKCEEKRVWTTQGIYRFEKFAP